LSLFYALAQAMLLINIVNVTS